LTSLEGLPSGITFIGESCFEGCTGLTALIGINTGLSSMGKAAFKNCTSLSNVEVLKDMQSLTVLPDEGFMNCSSIQYLPKSGSYIGANNNTYTYGLHWNLEKIGQDCFAGCTGIKYIGLRRHVPYIVGTNNEGIYWALSITEIIDSTNTTFPYSTLNEASVKVYIPNDKDPTDYLHDDIEVAPVYRANWGASGRFNSDVFVETRLVGAGV
jgi:hypothetical protein